MIPQDPYILLSFVNTKLRDEYGSLEELCAALDADEAALRKTLAALNRAYDADLRHFPRFHIVRIPLKWKFLKSGIAAASPCRGRDAFTSYGEHLLHINCG